MRTGIGKGEELRELVAANRTEIVERLGHYPLDRAQTDDLLDRVLGVLMLRWTKISDHRRWLLDELDRQCLRAIEGDAPEVDEDRRGTE